MQVTKKKTPSGKGWNFGEKKKKTRQGAGKNTKYGTSKGSIIKYRGQGGGIKSQKIN